MNITQCFRPKSSQSIMKQCLRQRIHKLPPSKHYSEAAFRSIKLFRCLVPIQSTVDTSDWACLHFALTCVFGDRITLNSPQDALCSNYDRINQTTFGGGGGQFNSDLSLYQCCVVQYNEILSGCFSSAI